ncbi:MAG: Rhodanese domain protein [Frankiales bacterium]|nr:Rhodanese domain protein [Frankiales bacterium]
MTRYVIIGAGAVGVTLAAELQRGGREVVLVGRGRQLELLRTGGVRYLRPDAAWTVDVPIAAGPDELSLTSADVLVLATKTQDADAVLGQWAGQPVDGGRARAGEVLPVFTMQNGLDAERSALRRFATVIGSVVWVPSTYVSDGVVATPSTPAAGVFWLGGYPDSVGQPASAATQIIAADLVAADFEVQVVEDLSRWKAGKLLGSATFVLDALYPAGPERDRAARLVQAEAREILTAAGFDPADTATESTVQLDRFGHAPIAGHERPGSSTFQSLARGRGVETDYLNGEIALLARQLRRRAPINEALLSRVHQAVQEGTQPGSLPLADLADVLAGASVLVEPATLRAELAGGNPPALLDVRWALGDPDGEKHFLDGHVPGAVFVDLETELAAPATAEQGRHPLPELSELQAAARTWGLRQGQSVVVYDDNGGQSAARAWWLLRWAGVSHVRILNGGLRSWLAGGGPVATDATRPDAGDVSLSAGHLPVLDIEATAALPAHGVLLDARAGERYRGEVEPVDSRAGHVPGAISVPTAGNLDADGRFRSGAELRERFAAAGVGASDVGVYCGSGVTAAHEIAALQVAGVDAALYPGSWSAWSADPSRPIATGPEAGSQPS